MVITAILAGIAAIGAALLIDQADRQEKSLQPIPVKSKRSESRP